jgi:hypothetical protein
MQAISLKPFLNIILAIMVATGWSSCKKDPIENPNLYGNVTLQVENRVGNEIAQAQTYYTNPAGLQYRFYLLKYILSNFELVTDAGESYKPGNYELVNAFDPASCNIQFDSVPSAHYSKLRFYLGMDSLANYTLTNAGDIDPSNGMVWTWATGYIFMKLEGNFLDSTGAVQPLLYHYGTLRAQVRYELPIDLTVSGNTAKLKMVFNLDEALKNPQVVDFYQYGVMQSTGLDEIDWINLLGTNMLDAFTMEQP